MHDVTPDPPTDRQPPDPGPDPLEPSRVLDLALGAGEILLSGGASASEVTVTCTEIAEAGGLHRVECDVTFTSLTLAGRPGPGEGTAISAMRLVHQRELDYTRVTAVHNLVSDFVGRRLDREGAARKLAAIAAARHPYPRVVVTLGRAMLAASVAVLLGGGLVVTSAAFGATVVIDLANGRLGRAGLPVFFLNALGGLVATATALGLVTAQVGVHPALVVAGGIVLLLPGVTLVGAVQDAITGFYVTASARAFEVFLLTAGIISGVAAALSIAVRFGLPIRIGDPPMPGLDQVPWQLLGAAVAAASFAVANHAPRRTVPPVGVVAAAAWGIFVVLDRAQLPPTLAAAAAAVLVGVGAVPLASWQRVPALVYVAAGVIPLLPGLAIYRGLRDFAEGDTLGGLSLLAEAISVGMALAAGAILGEFLAQAARRKGSHRDTRLLRRLTGLRAAEPPTWRRPGAATGSAGAPDPDHAGVRRRLPGHEGEL